MALALYISLVSLLFAVLVSLHPLCHFFSSRRMFELKFVITEVVKKQWDVALLG